MCVLVLFLPVSSCTEYQVYTKPTQQCTLHTRYILQSTGTTYHVRQYIPGTRTVLRPYDMYLFMNLKTPALRWRLSSKLIFAHLRMIPRQAYIHSDIFFPKNVFFSIGMLCASLIFAQLCLLCSQKGQNLRLLRNPPHPPNMLRFMLSKKQPNYAEGIASVMDINHQPILRSHVRRALYDIMKDVCTFHIPCWLIGVYLAHVIPGTEKYIPWYQQDTGNR